MKTGRKNLVPSHSEDLFVYSNSFKIGQYPTLLCICGNYKTFVIFLLECIIFE